MMYSKHFHRLALLAELMVVTLPWVPAQGARADKRDTLFLTQGKIRHMKTTEITLAANGKDINFWKSKTMFEIGSVKPPKMVNIIYATIHKKRIAVLIQVRPDSSDATAPGTQLVDSPVPRDTADRILKAIGPIAVLTSDDEQTILTRLNVRFESASGTLTKASIESPFRAVVVVQTSPTMPAQTFVVDVFTALEEGLAPNRKVNVHYVSAGGVWVATEIRQEEGRKERILTPEEGESHGAVASSNTPEKDERHGAMASSTPGHEHRREKIPDDTTSSLTHKKTWTLVGCVKKSDGNEYNLITGEGGTWEITSYTIDLAPHVGRMVIIKGVISNTMMHEEEDVKEGGKDEAKGHEKKTKEHGGMTVTNVKVVSDSCKK